MLEITKMLTLSTAHITNETSVKLNEDSFGDVEFPISVYIKQNYGWFIYLLEDDEKEYDMLPQDLANIAKFALANECEMICLDCDGAIIEQLKVYEW